VRLDALTALVDVGEEGVDAEHQRAGDGGVGQVVIGSGDDRQQGDRRVSVGDPAPAGALDPDEHHRHQQGPPEVQRRHCRELVGDRLVGVLGVDPRAVGVQRVDEAVLVEHARGSEWEGDVDHQRRQRHAQEPVPESGIQIAVPQHDPADEAEAEREVDEHVVVVEELDQPVEPHRDVLDAVLVEHVQGALDVDHCAGVGEGGVGVALRQMADTFVPDEGDDDQGDLAQSEPAVPGE
jgi:hypothetical protein